ncbi:MAG: sodium/proline symporter PutP [Gammaproteobacteria bacterium]|nr:sodium/proline symporter PutP [Gammaproteobacteria bacterium]
MADSPVIGATFLAYLVVVLVIGVVAWRRTANLSDYILGGRRLGSWVTALSAQASDMSGWLLLGLPGYAYLAGLESLWLLIGLLIGTYANWLFVAARLRSATERYGDSITLPDYFERRFDDRSGLLRIISAAFILIFFTFYTSSGLVAGGKLFEAVFGMPYLWAVAAGAAAVVAYTFIGGFLAVSWTDFIQGSLMFVALLMVVIMGWAAVSGWPGITAAMEARNPELLDMFSNAAGEPMTMIATASLLGWGLGYVGQPHILARFMAARSATETIPRARRIAMSWVTVTLICGTLVGLIGIAYLPEPLQGADSEKVFIFMASALFNPVVAGICLAGILAAVMSTADSQLLVASSAVSEDFYKGLLRKGAEQGELLWVGRLAVIGIAIVAFGFAMNPDSKVLDLVAYAWAGFGAAFGPAIVLSLYWRRMNRNGALAGIVTGGLTVIVWKQLTGGIFDLYEIVPGVIFATLAILIVSSVGKGRAA